MRTISRQMLKMSLVGADFKSQPDEGQRFARSGLLKFPLQ